LSEGEYKRKAKKTREGGNKKDEGQEFLIRWDP
jgi:hypothetical protein